jgi:hypothetical protein
MRLTPIVLAILSFLIVAQGISALALRLGFGDKYAVGTALQRALSTPDTTVLFVGTSRIKYGLDPILFDSAMKAKGFPAVSYNLGVPALSFVEMEYLIHEYFTRRPCCVKYVFLEPDIVQEASLREPNSVRSILFFSASNALRNIAYIFQEKEIPPPPVNRWIFAKYILIPLFRHYTNAGIFQSFLDDTHDNFRAQADLNGFISVAASHDRLSHKFEADLSLRPKYEEMLSELSAPYSGARISNKQFARFLDLMGYIRSSGAEPIVLRPPQFVYAPYSAAVVERIRAACSDAIPVMDFGRPSDNKEFYDPQNRIDYDHLSFEAAERFTQMVADRFATLLDAGSGTLAKQSPCMHPAAR